MAPLSRILPSGASPATCSARRSRRIRVMLASVLSLAAMSTSATALEITMFPARDFVEVGGLQAGQVIDVELFRNGALVGQARNIAAFEEAPGAGYLVLVNHPGGPDKCWEISTPDVIAGDVFKATITAGPDQGTFDAATVADVEVTHAPTEVNGDIVVKGFAQSAPGVAIPLAELEQRLIHAPGGDLFDNGTRRLQAPNGPNATLVFDTSGSIFWTATYKSLSDADRLEAQAAEARIMHFATDPTHLTIFEFGVPAGPFDATCPPIDRGPTLSLTPSSDTGISATDNLTRNTTPTFTGQRGTLTAGPVANLYETSGGTPVLIGTSPIGADGSFILTPSSPLSDGLHTLRAGHAGTGATDTLGPAVAVMIDATSPNPPGNFSVTPPPPADNNAPVIRGLAEATSTVRVFGNPGCTGSPFATTTAAAFLATGATGTVADDSVTTFAATAEDAAGNVSACGASALPYTEVTPKPLAALITSIATIRRTTWIVPLAVRCTGPVGTTCRGRLSLTIKGKNKRTGKITDVVLGTTTYVVKTGAKRTIKITLNDRGKALLTNRTSLKVRVKLTAVAGAGVATSTRTTITLRAPEVTRPAV